MRVARDKQLHFACCMLIAFVFTLMIGLMSNWYIGALTGLLTAMGTGVGKEYGDSACPDNKWDWYDILADFLGALVGISISIIILIL